MIQYLSPTPDSPNTLNPPATEAQIAAAEARLGISLPADYRAFLLTSNGFEGEVGEWVVILDPVEDIYQNTQDNCAEFFPWAVYLGTNGNLEMFLLDKRSTPYQFGLMPAIGGEEDFIPLGDTFEGFLKRLYEDDVFPEEEE